MGWGISPTLFILFGINMTRDKNNGGVVRLCIRDWVGMLAVVFTILTTFVIGALSIEQRLTEVVVRQEQLETRINRIEDTLDHTRRSQ
jgi:hypothetical protein